MEIAISPKKNTTREQKSTDNKVIYEVLNKNIRAIAAVATYDLLTQKKSMKLKNQFKLCFNAFHGNKDINIISQVNLLLKGHQYYGHLYNIEAPTLNTNRNTEDTLGDAMIYVLKKCYAQSNQRYICGKNVTKASLSSPTKAKINDKVTGQYIYNLALTVIRN